MLSVYGYYENGICIPAETLKLKNRQQVIITVVDDEQPIYRESPKKNGTLAEFFGIMDLGDGLTIQKAMRDEWT